MKKRKNGFTLVEIIVVLVIVAILAAATIPTLSGVVERADEAKLINETRSLLTVSQYLLSENYLSSRSDGETEYVVDYREAERLAEVPGTMKNLTYRGVMDVTHLSYERDGKYCQYCRFASIGEDCAECGAERAFTITEDATAYLVNMIMNSVSAITTQAMTVPEVAAFLSGNNKTIDSLALSNDSSFAKKIYNNVPASTQAMLNSVTWQLKSTETGLRLFFTLDDYGTGNSVGKVRVYKYAEGMGYQYNDNNTVVNGKIVFGNGNWYGNGVISEWEDDISIPGT